MKTIKFVLTMVVVFMIGVYVVPTCHSVIIKLDKQQQERVLEQKRIEKAQRDGQRNPVSFALVKVIDFSSRALGN